MSDATQPIPLLGQLAVKQGLLTLVQLHQCLRQQGLEAGRQSLGAIFVQRGMLTVEQVQQLLALQKRVEARAAAGALPPTPAVPVPVPVAPPVSPAAMAPFASPPVISAPARQAAPPPVPVRAPVPTAPPAAQIAVTSAAPLAAGQSRVPGLLEAAELKGASDVHFHTGAPAALRVSGRLGVASTQTLDVAEHARQILTLLTPPQRRQFEDTGDLDFAFVTPNGLRCRANVYRTHLGVDATFRLLRRAPQSLQELELPSAIARFTGYHQGLVLVTGPAGCGKSTTLASLIDLVNEERSDHVLIFEDPIEIVHPAKKALINQRQVGRDTESFARALRGALREDPDVIVIGELRDRETISLAVSAAETGHLVIGSMHTNSAARTVARLIDAFPTPQQAQVRAMLSESLRGVVTQRLVPTVDGKRAPAVEVLVVTQAIGNLIREGKLFQIRSQMQTGKALGMRTMDESLRELVASGKVNVEEAVKHAENAALVRAAAVPPPAPASPAAPLPAPPRAGFRS